MAIDVGFRRIAAVADLLARNHVPVAGLLDQAVLDAEIDDLAIFGKAMSIQQIDDAVFERRGATLFFTTLILTELPMISVPFLMASARRKSNGLRRRI
jgi:hypothetical protein